MLMEENRLKRLQEWIDEIDGKVATFVRHYQLPQTRASYLSQLLGGSRSFGERAARKLEAECGRTSGWLDVLPATDMPVEIIRYDRKRCSQLPPEDKQLIETFISVLLDRNDRRVKPRFNETSLISVSSGRIKDAARKPIKNPLTVKGSNAPQPAQKSSKPR